MLNGKLTLKYEPFFSLGLVLVRELFMERESQVALPYQRAHGLGFFLLRGVVFGFLQRW